MPQVNPEQFRMTPLLKNKANSQGTLFQGGKPVDAHRYPRGYTPQRMRDVRSRLTREYVSEEPTRLVTEATARDEGYAHLITPESKSQGVWIGGKKTTYTEHTIKDPAEQLAARRGGNKASCPTCVGTGVVPAKSWTSSGFAGDEKREYHRPAENCWNCGGNGSKPGSGKVSLREGDDTPERYGKDAVPEAGKSGIWDDTEIIPAGHHHPFLSERGRVHIEEAIARSTVPLDHIGFGSVGGRQRIRVSNNPAMKRANAAGHAIFGEIGLETSTGARPVGATEHYREMEKASSTLIHEIGHTAGAIGGEEHDDEARADAYMLQHYRPDPRNLTKRPAAMKGAQWLYSGHAGDAYDPDPVHAPGETDSMRTERLQRAPADNFRRGGRGPVRRTPPKQGVLF